jgi:hypothetical protein
MDNRAKKLAQEINTLVDSDHVFSPNLMKGLLFANFKAAEELKSEESISGIQTWIGLMVASLYDTPIDDYEVVTLKALEKVSNTPLPARKLGNLIGATTMNIAPFFEGKSGDFKESFIMSLIATTEIAVAEMEAEELL